MEQNLIFDIKRILSLGDDVIDIDLWQDIQYYYKAIIESRDWFFLLKKKDFNVVNNKVDLSNENIISLFKVMATDWSYDFVNKILNFNGIMSFNPISIFYTNLNNINYDNLPNCIKIYFATYIARYLIFKYTNSQALMQDLVQSLQLLENIAFLFDIRQKEQFNLGIGEINASRQSLV
jgi:hypothetical protein